MTRKWKDRARLMQLVKLFLIDEVHILKDPRGATLEAVVSRMKGIGQDVRFVALSATVPNLEDVARWLGRNSKQPQFPARFERFGEEFRPVKLQRFVYGYKCNTNEFALDKICESKPQFDRSAVAVIMTRVEKVKRYETMVSGQEALESWYADWS
ncbi:MAG: Sec63 [Phylliscum demangeonii]|nr:MAG: Sec63 [Phylliscum demangeonii]